MKKIILSILCLASLYGETTTSFFLGFGGGYGTKAKITDEERILEDKYYNALQKDSLKLEGVFGFETIFLNYFGIRYYTNIAQSRSISTDGGLTDLEYNFNIDLLLKIPVDNALALRFYTGIGAGSHILDLDKTLLSNIQKNISNKAYEVGYQNNLKSVALNLGLHFLFYDHHIIELGSKVLLLESGNIFYYRKTANQERRYYITYTTPKIELLAKYIFVF